MKNYNTMTIIFTSGYEIQEVIGITVSADSRRFYVEVFNQPDREVSIEDVNRIEMD